MAVNHGIRQFLAPDTIKFSATISASFSHAISIESDLDLAREACACLHWIKWPGRVSYAALPDTARRRLHGLLGLGSNATFDRRALDQLMSLAPGKHGPVALPASAGAAGTPAAPAPPVRAVPSGAALARQRARRPRAPLRLSLQPFARVGQASATDSLVCTRRKFAPFSLFAAGLTRARPRQNLPPLPDGAGAAAAPCSTPPQVRCHKPPPTTLPPQNAAPAPAPACPTP